jgi:hypothetical protein
VPDPSISEVEVAVGKLKRGGSDSSRIYSSRMGNITF